MLGCLSPAQTDSSCRVWRDMSKLANNPRNTQFSLSVESPEVETRRVEVWAHRQGGRQSGYSQSLKRQVLSYLLATFIYLEYMHESGESNSPFLFS